MGKRKTLCGIVGSAEFRERVQSQTDKQSIFWAYNDGTYSGTVSLQSLDKAKQEAQRKLAMPRDQIFAEGFKDEAQLTEYMVSHVKAWIPYAKQYANLALNLIDLRKGADPRLLVEVTQEQLSLKDSARLAGAGEHEIEEYLSRPHLTCPQALMLHSFSPLRPIYALANKERGPGTIHIALYQEKIKCGDLLQVAEAANALSLNDMARGKSAVAEVASKYYAAAQVLLHSEEGLLEKSEANKQLNQFKWGMPR